MAILRCKMEEVCSVGDEQQKSIILNIIAQLRKGTDLHRICLPTFVLEPRSMVPTH